MRTILTTIAAAALIASAASFAHAEQAADAQKKGAEHGGVMTEEMGKAVPKMTSDEDQKKESKAGSSEVYTKKVGDAVPKMTAPEDKSGEETKKQ